ncbi:hypothetical protein L6164_013752 [Bauhinia variegata]|uniref:Uncharacterized protein n=1 Tax=Bauhinia variegata TaxID=167791 RepID=A0ACB9NIT5_BAUVA|nr:hypothetical protein L6164_013752 [Bauhinia variegata]
MVFAINKYAKAPKFLFPCFQGAPNSAHINYHRNTAEYFKRNIHLHAQGGSKYDSHNQVLLNLNSHQTQTLIVVIDRYSYRLVIFIVPQKKFIYWFVLQKFKH